MSVGPGWCLIVGYLLSPRLACFQHHLSELYQVRPGGGRLEYGSLGGSSLGLEFCIATLTG